MLDAVRLSPLPFLPQVEQCRARPSNLLGYAQCQVERAWGCRYTVISHNARLCCHPHFRLIVEQTQAADAQSAQ